LEGDEVLPRAVRSNGDEGGEVKGDEIDEGCKGVVGSAEFSGVAGLRKIRGGEREVRETCLGDTEVVGEGDKAVRQTM
jgi:hypothetical protein